MKLDLRQKRFAASSFLFGLTCLTQALALAISPVEVFGKYVQAANLYLQSRLDPLRITDFSPFYFDLHVILADTFGSYVVFLRNLQILAAALCVVLFYLTMVRYLKNGFALIGAILLTLSSGLLVLSPIMIPEVWTLLFGMSALYFLVCYINDEAGMAAVICAGIFSGLSFLARPTFLLFIPFFILAILLQGKKDSGKTVLFYVASILIFGLALFIRNYEYTGRVTWMVMDPGGVFYEGNNPYSNGSGVNTPLIKDLEGQHLAGASYAQYLLKEFPSVIAGRKLNAEESNAYWRNKALCYIRENPAAYARLIVRKVACLFRTEEMHDVRAVVLHDEELKARHFPVAPFGILSSAAMIGLFIMRQDWRRLSLFYGGFIVYSLTPLIYFVSSRYRFGLSPFVIFFACGTLQWIWQRLVSYDKEMISGSSPLDKGGVRGGLTEFPTESSFNPHLPSPLSKGEEHSRNLRYTALVNRNYIRIALALVFIGGFALLINDPVSLSSHSYTWRSILKAHGLQAEAADLRNGNERALAAKKVADSLAAAPFLYEGLVLANLPYGKDEPWNGAILRKKELCGSDPDPDSCAFDLSFLLLQSKRYAEALPILEELATRKVKYSRWYLGSSEPLFYLARIASEYENNEAKAIQLYREALQENPGDFECLAGIYVALERAGKTKESDAYREKLFCYTDEIDATYFLGKAYWYAKDYRNSARCFVRAAQWLPDERRLGVYAAVALGASGNIEESIAAYGRILNRKQDPLLLQQAILEIFGQYLKMHPGSAEAHHAVGVVQRQFGDWDESRRMQQQALQINPDYEPSQREIELLNSVTN